MLFIFSGRTLSSSAISFNCFPDNVPLLFAIIKVINASDISWQVKAFVEATPISGPACIYVPASTSLAIVLPITLTIPIVVAPSFCASFMAARVSAVSPLWLISITTSSLLIIGFLYLNSEAYSTSVGILQYCSSIYSPTKPACQAVPHPVIINLFALNNLSETFSRPPSFTTPVSKLILPLYVFCKASGCSQISFSIKCSKPLFSISVRSNSIFCTSLNISSSEIVLIWKLSLLITAISPSSR